MTREEVSDLLFILTKRRTPYSFEYTVDCIYMFDGETLTTVAKVCKKWNRKQSSVITGTTKCIGFVIQNNSKEFINEYFGGVRPSRNIPLKKFILGVRRLLDEGYTGESIPDKV